MQHDQPHTQIQPGISFSAERNSVIAAMEADTIIPPPILKEGCGMHPRTRTIRVRKRGRKGGLRQRQ